MNHQSRVIYVAKLPFQCEGEIKAFPVKQKVRNFSTRRPPLQEMSKGALLPETKRQKCTKHWIMWLTEAGNFRIGY